MASRPPAQVRAAAICAAALMLMACGEPSHAAGARPTPTPAPTSATSTSSPTADDETLQVFASGLGGYELDTNPVAVLHNLAADHTATGVVVTFTVHFPGGTYSISSSPDMSLFPGQTLAVATTCNRACDDSKATSTDVAVAVGSWVSGGGTPLTVTTSPTYACVSQDDLSGCLKNPQRGHPSRFEAPELADILRLSVPGFSVFSLFYPWDGQTLTVITLEHTAQDLPSRLASIVSHSRQPT